MFIYQFPKHVEHLANVLFEKVLLEEPSAFVWLRVIKTKRPLMMVDPPTNNQFPKWGGFSADSFQLPELTFVFGLQATICSSVTVSHIGTIQYAHCFENVQIEVK